MWIVRDGTIWGSARTSAGEAFYGNACDPEPGERWEVYVNRSAREATDTVINPWWRAELTEPEPYRIYFNVTWADRTWFQAQGEFL